MLGEAFASYYIGLKTLMSLSKNVLSGVGVAHVMRPADRTVPFAHGKRKLFIVAHDMPAYAACLRGVLRRYKNDLAFIHLAFLLQKRQKRSPSGIADRLCKAVILQQIAYLKILRCITLRSSAAIRSWLLISCLET